MERFCAVERERVFRQSSEKEINIEGKFKHSQNAPSEADRPGTDVSVQPLALPPLEMQAQQSQCYSIVLHTGSPAVVEWLQKGRMRQQKMCAGNVSLHVPGELPGFRLHQKAKLIEISLSAAFVQQTLPAESSLGRPLWKEVYGQTDPQIERIGWALRSEKEAGSPGGRLFETGLAAALTAHLSARYGTETAAPPASGGRLPHSDLQRVLDFIHSRLEENLSLAQIASQTPYSVHHFALLFRQTLGCTPHQYVIGQRLETALSLLRSEETGLAEVALQVGFANQSHLNLHFKRRFGITPRQFRQNSR